MNVRTYVPARQPGSSLVGLKLSFTAVHWGFLLPHTGSCLPEHTPSSTVYMYMFIRTYFLDTELKLFHFVGQLLYPLLCILPPPEDQQQEQCNATWQSWKSWEVRSYAHNMVIGVMYLCFGLALYLTLHLFLLLSQPAHITEDIGTRSKMQNWISLYVRTYSMQPCIT